MTEAKELSPEAKMALGTMPAAASESVVSTQARHTPGPWDREGACVWTLYQIGWDRGAPIMGNRFSLQVQHCQGGNARTGERYGCSAEEAIANARLIAAAPDLLAALIFAREQLEHYENERTGESYNSLQINAAIAKAVG